MPSTEWRNKNAFLLSLSALALGFAVLWANYLGSTQLVLIVFLIALVVFPVLTQLPLLLASFRALAARLRWWHLAWLLVFLSGLVFRGRDIDSIYSNPLDFWALFRIALMAAVMLMLLGQLLVRSFNWLPELFQGATGWLAVYSLINMLSSIWSVYPLWTLYRSLEYFVDIWLLAATITAVRRQENLKDIFNWNLLLTLTLVVSIWLGMAYAPTQAIIRGVGILGPQIRGVIPVVAANGVGELGALLSIIALTRLLFPTPLKRTYLGLFLTSVGTLLLSQSRSPLMGFLLAVPLVLFAARRIKAVLLLVLLLPAMLSVTSLGDLFWRFFMRGQSQELFAGLSGRMDWWKFGLPFLLERPLLGYGAYAGGRFTVLAALGVTLSASIHNTWLEALLGTGLLGLLPLLAAFFRVWLLLIKPQPARTWNPERRRLHAEATGIFAVLAVRSMFTTTLIWHPPLMFLLVIVCLERLLPKRSRGAYKAIRESNGLDILEPGGEK